MAPQLEELEPKKQTDRHGRAITINDQTKIKETIIQLKRTPRPEGLLDSTRIADIDIEEYFECGVINKNQVNKGTLSGLGSGNNAFKSSIESSKFDNWKLTKEKPLNSSNKEILGCNDS